MSTHEYEQQYVIHEYVQQYEQQYGNQEDVQQYLAQSVEAYQETCRKRFTEHKFDAATVGLTIGNHIMMNSINARITDAQPGQRTTMD